MKKRLIQIAIFIGYLTLRPAMIFAAILLGIWHRSGDDAEKLIAKGGQ